ncbi:MAG: PRC-barrel domain-containing protein [Minwuia sp.]|uniref:PRC-barrel domain-containing protein n=1 Tax=Minwuia sp. TaxID=2493630 RepID=UPI003A856284
MYRKALLSTALIMALSGAAAHAETGVKAETDTQTGVSVGKVLSSETEAGAGADVKSAAEARNSTADEMDKAADMNAGAATTAGVKLSAESIGSDAVDITGEKVGKVVDVVNNANGDADTVVVATSGILLGLGGRDVAVPAESVSLDSEASIISMTGAQIDELPDYNR